MLGATTACTFSTSQLPKVVREWCALYMLTSKCASRHNGVHFFMCGAKHISKSKCLGPLLEVQISKKCTPLWREAHFKVKMFKTLGVRTTFGGSDLEKVHAVVARRTFRSKNVQNTRGSDHFWRLRCRFAWQAHEIVVLVKSAQNMRVLRHFDKRWQAWDICR